MISQFPIVTASPILASIGGAGVNVVVVVVVVVVVAAVVVVAMVVSAVVVDVFDEDAVVVFFSKEEAKLDIAELKALDIADSSAAEADASTLDAYASFTLLSDPAQAARETAITPAHKMVIAWFARFMKIFPSLYDWLRIIQSVSTSFSSSLSIIYGMDSKI